MVLLAHVFLRVCLGGFTPIDLRSARRRGPLGANGPQGRLVRLGASAPPLPKKFFDTVWEPYKKAVLLARIRGSEILCQRNCKSAKGEIGRPGGLFLKSSRSRYLLGEIRAKENFVL